MKNTTNAISNSDKKWLEMEMEKKKLLSKVLQSSFLQDFCDFSIMKS